MNLFLSVLYRNCTLLVIKYLYFKNPLFQNNIIQEPYAILNNWKSTLYDYESNWTGLYRLKSLKI